MAIASEAIQFSKVQHFQHQHHHYIHTLCTCSHNHRIQKGLYKQCIIMVIVSDQ